MLREAIERIVSLGRSSDAVELINLERVRRTLVRHGDTIIEQHDWPAPLRRGSCNTLEDLEQIVDCLATKAELYVGSDGVELLLDSNERLSSFRLAFFLHERFVAFAAPIVGTPKDVLRRLRRAFAGEDAVEKFADTLRHVDFTRTSTGKSHVEHGRESLGRSVEAQVVQAQDIPRALTISTPVFANTGFRTSSTVQVRLLVELDPEEGTVSLLPPVGEIAEAKRTALDRITEQLRGKFLNALVVQGSSAR